jgi:hypothetical protein
LVGLVLVAAGAFAGPAGAARSARRMITPFLRERPAGTYAITLGIMLLIFIWDPIPATGTPAGIIVFTVLALLGTYVLRRQAMTEFPDAEHGAMTAKLRAQLQARQQRRQRAKSTPAAAPTGTMPEQLRQLVELRDHGEITGEEYQAAKDELLHNAR